MKLLSLRACLLLLWNTLDPLYYFFTRLTSLATRDTNRRNVFRVRLTCYKGADVTLSDGTVIKHNDILLKIHFHNVQIMKELKHINNGMQKAIWLYRAAEQSLPGLAAYIKTHKRCHDIQGIIGITMLNSASGRLGFDTISISNRCYRWFKWFTQLPIQYLSGPELSWKERLKHQPNYLFMSKTTLFERYSK